MKKLDYLHNFPIEEQLMMEIAKIQAKYEGTKDYSNTSWFVVLAEEFGEVAMNINEQSKSNYTKESLQENLEYELLQVMAVCKLWLMKLRNEVKK